MKDSEVFESLGGKMTELTEDTECPILRLQDRQLTDKEREIKFVLKDGGTAKVNSRFEGEPDEYVNSLIASAVIGLASSLKNKQKR